MTTRQRRLLAVGIAALALLLFAGTAFAKGPPAKVTIEGPGIDEPITVTDSDMLGTFAFYVFNAPDNVLDAPPEVDGEGYTITRYVRTSGAQIPWDTLTYYPNPDGADVLYFDGLVSPASWTEGQGEWYTATTDGEAAMRGLLAGPGAPGALSAGRIAVPAMALTALLLFAAAALLGAGQRTRATERTPA